MSNCLVCGEPIDTQDSLIAIEKHVPPKLTPAGELVKQKGCSLEFRWVKTGSCGDAPSLGSMLCALEYFQRWLEDHMVKPRVT